MLSIGSPIPPPPELPESAPPAPERVALPGRYASLDQHELVRLLDTIDDEVARARFRESIYISLFICIAIAWFAFYGPVFILHRPHVVDPFKALSDHEIALNAPPDLAQKLARQAKAPKAINNQTMKQLQQMQKTEEAVRASHPAPKPTETAQPESPKPTPQPQQAQQAPPPPPPPTNAPTPNLPPTPKPTEQAMVEAPRPQPTKPNFGTQQSAGDAIRQAAQQSAQNHAPTGGSGAITESPIGRGGAAAGSGFQVLSDTQGVDFGPYLKQIFRMIETSWRQLLPAEIQPPISKKGVTELHFVILPDGKIGDITLENSTHDDALNRAAWGSIQSQGAFPPLPAQFHGPNLTLGVIYLVNQPPQ